MWRDLPPDLANLVFEELRAPEDRAAFRMACSSWAEATTERCTHLSPLQPLVALALNKFPALRSLDLRRARPPTAADVASLASASASSCSSKVCSGASARAPRRRVLLTSVASALPAVPASAADAVALLAAEAVRVAAERAAAAAAAEEEEEEARPRSADENAEPSFSSSSISPSPPPCPLSLPSTPADDVAAALAAPPMLRELSICAAGGLTDVGMAKLAATLLRGARALPSSSYGNDALFPSSSPAPLLLPRLVSLTISGASRVTDAGVIALATALAGEERKRDGEEEEGEGETRGGEREALLEELRLPLLQQQRLAPPSSSPSSSFSSRSPLGGLGDSGARSLARLLPRLRAVDLRGHSRLTPAGVAALAANARCLRALWLGGGVIAATATQRGSFDSSSLLDSAATDAGVAAAVVGAGETLELLFVEAPAVSPAVRRQQQRTGAARNGGGAAANAAAAATAAAAEAASDRGDEAAAAALHAAAACDHDALTAAALGLVAVHAPRMRRLSLRGAEWGRGKTVVAAAVAAGSSSSSPPSSSSSSFLLLPELEELDVSTPSPSSSSGAGAPPLEALSLRRLAALRASGTPMGGPGVRGALERARGSLKELRVVGCGGFGREQLRALGGGGGGGEEGEGEEEHDGDDDETLPLPLSLLDVRGCECLERATADDWRCGLGLLAAKGTLSSSSCKTLLRELAVGCRPPAAAEAAAALFFSAADADAILLGDGSLAPSAALTALGRAKAVAPSSKGEASSTAPLLERLTLRGARLSCADALAVGSLPSLAHLDVSGCVPEATESMLSTTTERNGGAVPVPMPMPELLAEGLRRGALAREGRLDLLGEGFASRPEFRAPVRHLNLSHTGACGFGGGSGSESSKSNNSREAPPPPASSPLPLLPSSPLALLLAETPRLSSIDLSGTDFGDADAPALSLCSESLRSLVCNGSGCGAWLQRALNFSASSTTTTTSSAAADPSSSSSNQPSRYERAGVGSLSDAGLAALAAAAPRLERLSLASGGCRGVGPEGLRAALSRLPQLTHVDLSGAVMSAAGPLDARSVLKALRRCERLRELEFGKGSGVRKSAACSSDGGGASSASAAAAAPGGPSLSSLRSPSPTPMQQQERRQQQQQQWGNIDNNHSTQGHATTGGNRMMTIDDSWAAVAAAALAAGATVVYPAEAREEKGQSSSSSSSLPCSPFRSSLRRCTIEQQQQHSGSTTVADAAALVVVRPLRAASSGHVRALLARAPSLSRVDLGEEGRSKKGSSSSSSSRLVLTSRDAAAASLRGLGLGCLLDVAAALEAAAAAAAGVAARVRQRGVSLSGGASSSLGSSIPWPSAGRRVAPDS